jgi:hypothetical protein
MGSHSGPLKFCTRAMFLTTTRLADHGEAWLHLLLDEHRGGQFHALAAFLMPARKNSVRRCCLTRARADIELAGDLLVAATLDKQAQDFLVSGGDLDLVEANQGLLFAPSMQSWGRHPP